MDLLSVMAHELGHIVLGMDESSQPNDVMTEALQLDVRRMPTPYDLGLEPSAAWTGSHTGDGLKEPPLTAQERSILLLNSLFASGSQTTQFFGACAAVSGAAYRSGGQDLADYG